MDDKSKANHGTKAFDVGALAVEHSDPAPGKGKTKPGISRLGSVAVKNADERLIEPGEVIEKVVHRHPIGIFGTYVEMVTGIIVILACVFFAARGSFGNLPAGVLGWLAFGALLLISFLVIILLMSNFVYRSCRIIITDQSLVAVVQQALFSRRVSRLSMSNVEDVTAEQKGILPTIFNYGTITIQTAGQEDNFIFPFCPKPNDVADVVLGARQAYVRKHDD